MALIFTSHGDLEESTLSRTLQFTENDREFTVTVEWHLGDELVKRDAHVIIKRPGVVATLFAGGVG